MLATLSPKLNLQVENKINPNADLLQCEYTIKSLKDFSPEKAVEATPALNKLLAMRNLLKDLKANILDNQSFRKKLESILKDANKATLLSNELKKIQSAQ